MAFSKESFDISQYKTGWFCAKKGFSKKKFLLFTKVSAETKSFFDYGTWECYNHHNLKRYYP